MAQIVKIHDSTISAQLCKENASITNIIPANIPDMTNLVVSFDAVFDAVFDVVLGDMSDDVLGDAPDDVTGDMFGDAPDDSFDVSKDVVSCVSVFGTGCLLYTSPSPRDS